MTDSAKAQMPKPQLATEDWTAQRIGELETRMEAGFLSQTKYLLDKIDIFKSEVNAKIDTVNGKIDAQTRWMVGLMITMTIAIITAVLLK